MVKGSPVGSNSSGFFIFADLLDRDKFRSYISYPMNDFKIIQIENKAEEPVRTVILPDNSIVLAFQSGAPVYELISGKPTVLPRVHICGQLTQKKEYLREPGSKSTLIKFQPWQVGLLINGLHEFTDQNIELNSLANSKLEERLLNDEILADNIGSLLSDIVNNYKNIDKSILNALLIIKKTKGQIKVEELAYQVCNSKRNFERKFREAIGLTPKKYITNARFRHSVSLLLSDEDLTGISYDCGYYDQSHFIHDFKSITGVAPESYPSLIRPIENWALAKKVYS